MSLPYLDLDDPKQYPVPYESGKHRFPRVLNRNRQEVVRGIDTVNQFTGELVNTTPERVKEFLDELKRFGILIPPYTIVSEKIPNKGNRNYIVIKWVESSDLANSKEITSLKEIIS